ncbi:hypothetical protein STEG23_017771, partial [Scotinomys teguina]
LDDKHMPQHSAFYACAWDEIYILMILQQALYPLKLLPSPIQCSLPEQIQPNEMKSYTVTKDRFFAKPEAFTGREHIFNILTTTAVMETLDAIDSMACAFSLSIIW